MMSKDIASDDIAIPEVIQQPPKLQGTGNRPSLQVTMAKDETGRLQELVTAFLQAPTLAERNQLFEDILFQWAGVGDIVLYQIVEATPLMLDSSQY